MIRKKAATKEQKSFNRNPCWLEELERLDRQNTNIEKRTKRFEAEYWSTVDKKYEDLISLDQKAKEVKNEYPENLAEMLTKFMAKAAQRRAQEEIFQENLEDTYAENERLEAYLLELQQYERIGRVRDQEWFGNLS